ncbi:hypothetical protein [[Clostridium] dakarense]|uniref:hypothetical protein n=1 Tax=Faecalimicrobium dakarense TaxID=1301100 RepID=UPI0004B6D57B|nr:hypothetical protein [[Clostridium] dakarense]
MEEIYRLIEEKIKEAGHEGNVSGKDIYDEICDQIEEAENGSYIFMSKKDDDVFFEYKIDVMDDNFNLSYIDINTPQGKIHVDFDN